MGETVKPLKLKRTKTTEPTYVNTGKGLPQIVTKNLRREDAPSSPPEPTSVGEEDYHFKRSSIRRSLYYGPSEPKKASIITNLSAQLDLEEYEFPEDDFDDPASHRPDVKMDVTALDRYNDDIRRIRKMCIDECRSLPQRGDLDDLKMSKIKMMIRSLCRTAYYGTHKAQVLAEGGITLIVWLLNRKNISMSVKVHILQSFAEMIWYSPDLKFTLYRCNGVKLIAKLLINGVKHRTDQSQWACYTLAMACTSSVEIIETLQGIDRFDEIVGEISFYPYWYNWPANFGAILQGILFGPHSLIPEESTYEFI